MTREQLVYMEQISLLLILHIAQAPSGVITLLVDCGCPPPGAPSRLWVSREQGELSRVDALTPGTA